MSVVWQWTGRVWRFGDAVSIEAISPLRYMLSPHGRGRACLAVLDADFAASEKDGDLIVAGSMFGIGPGHDHAILAIKESGVAGVVATSFAPQFLRHAVGHGLLVATAPQSLTDQLSGDELSVDFLDGTAADPTTGRTWDVQVPRGPAREIVDAGGLVPYLRGRLDADLVRPPAGGERPR